MTRFRVTMVGGRDYGVHEAPSRYKAIVEARQKAGDIAISFIDVRDWLVEPEDDAAAAEPTP